MTRTKPGKYFAIWGCHQISESKYNRGLWVFGANKNQTNMKVKSAQQMVTEALIDMKLENQTAIWENMIINVNKFTPPDHLNCSIKRYNNQCNFHGFGKVDGPDGKVLIFIFVVVALVVVAFIASIYIYYTF